VKSKLFAQGDLVWKVILPMDRKNQVLGKWSPSWEGPWQILRVFSNNVYEIEELNDDQRILRINGKYLKMVRSMLATRNVPKVFWPEAVVWATHVLNRGPALPVKDMTPEEAWSGVKPSRQHFRVFGCIAYVHVPDSQRRKLDDKSTKCILLGLSGE